MTARPSTARASKPAPRDVRWRTARFGEDNAHHDTARAAWAWAHGLVSLEIAGRFPDGADVDAAWHVLVETLTSLTASAHTPPRG